MVINFSIKKPAESPLRNSAGLFLLAH